MPAFGNFRMKKACIFNPYWDSLGGGERYTAAFVKFLLDQGWQVDIFWPGDISPQILDRFGLDISRAKFISHPYHSLSTTPYSLLFWLSDGSLPISFAKKTIIHLQFPFQNIHGHSFANFVKSRSYTFVVNSLFTKSAIDSEFSVDSHVVYPPIDTTQFTAGKKHNHILYIGRFSQLTQLKNHSVLIDAFRNLHPHLPNWKLILAGGTTVGSDPQYLSGLKTQARGLPVDIVTDPSYSKIRDLCSQAKIFWSASGYSPTHSPTPLQTEHFGITVVEAMAAGAVPVITNLGGHREIVVPGDSGFLWDNPSELQSFTVRLASDPSLFNLLSQKAIDRSKIFDIQKFNQKLSKLI